MTINKNVLPVIAGIFILIIVLVIIPFKLKTCENYYTIGYPYARKGTKGGTFVKFSYMYYGKWRHATSQTNSYYFGESILYKKVVVDVCDDMGMGTILGYIPDSLNIGKVPINGWKEIPDKTILFK